MEGRNDLLEIRRGVTPPIGLGPLAGKQKKSQITNSTIRRLQATVHRSFFGRHIESFTKNDRVRMARPAEILVSTFEQPGPIAK